MASETNIFGTNQRFKDAVDLINTLPDDRFPLVLVRLIQKLHLKNEDPFTTAEKEQLQNVFSLKAADVQAVIDSCSFIFEQAAYYAVKSDIFGFQLEKSGFSSGKVNAFQNVWSDGASDLLSRLRKQTLIPQQLSDVSWRFHMQMAQSTLSKLKEPSALFRLHLKSTSGEESDRAVNLEFGREELFSFFTKLEMIQEQLDNLV
ncbi:hypothetical protein PROFUN_02383 [Planoprotostelium fungivorum]|uniref:COMM domain-containing protein n=1 Tax=Planoprotostelium fungivorum TaxID=1890364 RepID=A0A2P6NUN7_9EUKA|nr:hypothetical protein PROFUN_02383 [Planoprotostelium fungivorum]